MIRQLQTCCQERVGLKATSFKSSERCVGRVCFNLKEQLKRQSFTERHNTVTLRSWKADIRRIWSYVGVALTHSLQFAHRTVRGHECKKPISWHK